MSYLLCNRIDDTRYQLFCASCDKDMDIVDGDFIRWCVENSEIPVCLECDRGSDEIPESLWPYEGSITLKRDFHGKHCQAQVILNYAFSQFPVSRKRKDMFMVMEMPF